MEYRPMGGANYGKALRVLQGERPRAAGFRAKPRGFARKSAARSGTAACRDKVDALPRKRRQA